MCADFVQNGILVVVKSDFFSLAYIALSLYETHTQSAENLPDSNLNSKGQTIRQIGQKDFQWKSFALFRSTESAAYSVAVLLSKSHSILLEPS